MHMVFRRQKIVDTLLLRSKMAKGFSESMTLTVTWQGSALPAYLQPNQVPVRKIQQPLAQSSRLTKQLTA